MSTLGARIRLARTMRGWNMSEMARRANTTPSVISRFESGHRGRAPEAETISKFAGVLEVRPEWLLTGRGAMGAEHVEQESQRELAARVALEGGIAEEVVGWVLGHPQAPKDDRPALWWLRWMIGAEYHFALAAYSASSTTPRPPSAPPVSPTLPSFAPPTPRPPSSSGEWARGPLPRPPPPPPAELFETKLSQEKPAPASDKPRSTPRRKK